MFQDEWSLSCIVLFIFRVFHFLFFIFDCVGYSCMSIGEGVCIYADYPAIFGDKEI